MAKSAQLSEQQIREAMRLVGECRDVGHDPAAWNLRVACYFQEQLRSVFTSCFIVKAKAGVEDSEQTLCTFWADNRLHRRWSKHVAKHGYCKCASVQKFIGRYDGRAMTAARRDLISNREWSQCAERDDRRAVHQDELMLSVQPVNNGTAHLLSVNRAAGDRPFSSRDASLVRLVHDELGRLFGNRLSLSMEARTLPDNLPSRLQAVLICLLAGDGDKEIANRLGLSAHTIHEYVTALYRRFDVHSRAELFSLAVRNHWLSGGLGAAVVPPPSP